VKNHRGFAVYVCLAAAFVFLVSMNLLAQNNGGVGTGGLGVTGQDPGPQQLPPVSTSLETCTSASNPNHVIDTAQANPHALNLTTYPIPTPLQNIGQNQLDLFCAAIGRFQEIDSVSGVVQNATGTGGLCVPVDQQANGGPPTISCFESGAGLGPRFNGNSCMMCHFFPNFLGASGVTNPEAAAVALPLFVTSSGGVGNLDGGTNTLTGLAITPTSAVREVRFIDVPGTGTADGGVHNLFTIKGRVDATNAQNMNHSLGNTTCEEQQPNFAEYPSNLVYRIPIVMQGDGLVELIDDENLEANVTASVGNGVAGTFNRSGNDGTITRFGWKAQNKSMAIFSGEAYNVEQGVTNDLFPNERRGDDDLLSETMTTIVDCQFNPLPDDLVNFITPGTQPVGTLASQVSTDVFNFSAAARLSAPPPRLSMSSGAIAGQAIFVSIGCNQCHSNNSTGEMQTISNSSFPAGQNSAPVLAFSDFAIHEMASGPGTNPTTGLPCLDDSVQQGLAAGNYFRSAPLWGLSTRQFLLHDGSQSSLGVAIVAHSCPGSEANYSVTQFQALSPTQQTDLFDYLRTL
jgi:CxxC motif-containing protein (DUF1111 family)